jgi:hypothetical protein
MSPVEVIPQSEVRMRPRPASSRRLTRALVRIVVLVAFYTVIAWAEQAAPATERATPNHWCGYESPTTRRAQRQAAIALGEIENPSMRSLPIVPTRDAGFLGTPDELPCLSPAQIFQYEDTEGLLLTDFSFGQYEALMTEASNAAMAAHGDIYDFAAFWTSFATHHQIGAAFYDPIFNDVEGLGDPSIGGTPIFNARPDLGLAGNNLQGYITMWDINSGNWAPGTGPDANFARLALAQEFEHRWALFLPDLLNGLPLQGDNGPCGRAYHWNWRIDGQGSGMEIAEWVGTNGASPEGLFINFNTDTGGVFSYADLYLMGYLSPAEMDAGNSEFRYMDGSTCGTDYFGPITQLSSADIVATAGLRIPDHTASPKNFRTVWIMFYQPGDPPSDAELGKAVAILEQHQIDWRDGTLGLGRMNNQSCIACKFNDQSHYDEIMGGMLLDSNTNKIPDQSEIDCGGSVDCDKDGVDDLIDNCPFIANDVQDDQDADGVGNVCDNCSMTENFPQVDEDADGLGNACDNCPDVANPLQGQTSFDRQLNAPSTTQFCWSDPRDIDWVRGDLDQVSMYATTFTLTEADAACVTDADAPVAGEGFYYLLRSDCGVASWQTEIGSQPDRDLFLPAP